MNSIWSETTVLPEFSPLQEDIKTEVLIIGGGMAGILCAYMLSQAGVDYVLVEADKICSGITKNTTAKITFQHGMIYHKLLDKFGVERARKYLDINQWALKKYRRLCKNIDCDYMEKDAFVYSLNDKKVLEKERQTLETIGFPTEVVEDLKLPFSTAGAIRFREQAQFHPLKFVKELAKELNIYEDTKVEELGKGTAITENGKITAEKIIVATHFPFLNKHGSYFLKMYQHRSYVIALENAADVKGMYVDEAQKGLSFRNYKDLLLIGGGDHRTGKQGGNWKELEGFSREYYPKAREKYRWATQDCMTLDEIPYIGKYSKNTEGLYVATGFNKWGMTSSMAAAQILTDQILGEKNPYEEVFSPSRTMLRPQILVNGFEAVKNLITVSEKRCPHMGCALKWNPQEHSWDCPCHGSRFEEDGGLIDNPATGDLEGK
ncbi:MAG: FAD-dependent oxidoreductase [Schaedlerella sp.]|nr:FAD-dependent oxidoreductase [Schaedlerella sp.]